MSDESAITVEHVSKAFKLPHEKQTSVKSALISVFQRGAHTYERQEVLKDVSFQIKKGEFFGIVGRNGSGKSTLLKMLAGIYTPTKGNIQVNGKLTPFIELGVGFNPELTGRENVFLNGALLGFNRAEMDAMYEDIVAFAELERFMDQKLKNYSSGMQVRLAFSIAIRARSDILVLDEVLAVGDEAFQQKCIDVFEKYKSQKQTIVLVTHDMEIVRRFCSRAMLLDKGKLRMLGSPSEVSREYSRLNDEIVEKNLENNNTSKQSMLSLKLYDAMGKQSTSFSVHDTLRVHIQWPARLASVKNVGVAIVKNSGEFMFGTNTHALEFDVSGREVDFEVTLDIGPGKYHIMAGLFGETEREVIEFVDFGPEFLVRRSPDKTFDGMVRLPYAWNKQSEIRDV